MMCALKRETFERDLYQSFTCSMSGSKRPTASVASFRNNVEEDFTV
jgi:hypothetical protein